MCTLERRGNIFILTLTGDVIDDEHRLNPTRIDAIQSALRRVRAESTKSSALITTARGKFFSNGYDLAWAQSSFDRLVLMDFKLRSLIYDLISLPMPTIAAISGHASAAGCILALCHDYRLMRSDRGFLYMSEMDIKLVITRWFIAVIEAKVGAPSARRDLLLKAAKVTAEQAVKIGLVDSAHEGPEETVDAAVKLAEELGKKEWDGEVYGETRKKMLVKVLDEIAVDDQTKFQSKL